MKSTLVKWQVCAVKKVQIILGFRKLNIFVDKICQRRLPIFRRGNLLFYLCTFASLQELQPKTSSPWANSLNKVVWLIFYIVLKLTTFFDMRPKRYNYYFYCKKFTKSHWKLKFCTSYSYQIAFKMIISLQT